MSARVVASLALIVLSVACSGSGDTLPADRADVGPDPGPSDVGPDFDRDTQDPEDEAIIGDVETPQDVDDVTQSDDTDTPDLIDVTADVSVDAELDPIDDLGQEDAETDATEPDHSQCPGEPLDTSGSAWEGWANVQWPARLTATVGQSTEPFYGRVWRAGETELAGQAQGWEAELLVGPLGGLPTEDPECWRRVDASYNVDDGNNDEYSATLRPWAPGLFGLYYRYRPPDGAWLYGDLDGSDNGLHPTQAAVMEVVDDGVNHLTVVTLNLRCQADDWAAREPLVIRALVALQPDLIGFQEDCAAAGHDKQSVGIRAQLAAQLDRGYELVTTTTHQGEHDGQTYDEGIALMSRFPIASSTILDLPYNTFPRKAIRAEIHIDGETLFFYDTHFDYGAGASDDRLAAAQVILDDLAGRRGIVVGDLNETPGSPAVTLLASHLSDAWADVNGGGGQTMPATNPAARIDYIFVADPLGTPTNVTLIDENEGGVFLSDHLGVRADISL